MKRSLFKAVNIYETDWTVIEKSLSNMIQNQYVHATFCRPEVDNDAISGHNVKTPEGYVVVNFEAVNSSFSEIFKISKIILWRRRQRRPSTTASSESAFAFRLKDWILILSFSRCYSSRFSCAPCIYSCCYIFQCFCPTRENILLF